MKTVAHTPGPWKHDKGGGIVPGSHEWHVYANKAPVGKKLPAICDSEANARLVAAAPELLASAMAALDLVESEGRDTGMGDAFSDMRASIAKATGGAA